MVRARYGIISKTVHVLCSMPLGLAVDELVAWKQLTGDRRLSGRGMRREGMRAAAAFPMLSCLAPFGGSLG